MQTFFKLDEKGRNIPFPIERRNKNKKTLKKAEISYRFKQPGFLLLTLVQEKSY